MDLTVDAKTDLFDDAMYEAVRKYGAQAFELCRMPRDYYQSSGSRVLRASEFPDDAAETIKIRLSTLRGYYSTETVKLGKDCRAD